MVCLYDIGMDQIGDQACFPNEITSELFNFRVFLADQFHSDTFNKIVRAPLLGLVNDTHASFSDNSHKLEMQFVEYVFELTQ